jgi:uncharacterized protein
MYIVDRRLNPGGKSLGNRQRFLRRARELARRAVRDSIKDRSIKDLGRGGEVTVPDRSLSEPVLRRASEGVHDYVLPGNKEYLEGDTIPRPPGGGGGGGGNEGSADGEGQDDFRFALSQEEYLDIFLEDLELPDLRKRKLATAEKLGVRRAGYSTSGSPSNLAVVRTMRNSLSRRIALQRPKLAREQELAAEVEDLERSGADPERLEALQAELRQMRQRMRRISYIDPIDLRFHQFVPQRKTVAQAVMFCLMDVSGSMTEEMKELAKRFFMLLHIFLRRRYHHVEIVFIRHTQNAEEVDEQTFFYSTETGGTVVSTALELMAQICAERYRPEDWNIYGAQASDGDNEYRDGPKVAALLKDVILPVSQYFAYIEVGRSGVDNSELWAAYDTVKQVSDVLAMKKVRSRSEIYPVFRELFRAKGQAQEA